MALFTTIPTSSTAPTITVAPIAVWVMNKPKMPPAKASGTVSIITSGSISELYCTAMPVNTKKAASPPKIPRLSVMAALL